MNKKILYIHGLGSDANSTTFQTLKEEFSQYEWVTDTFNLLDVETTRERIAELVRKEQIKMVVASSLGAFYALGISDSLAKVVINPCMRPSVEIPKLVVGVDIDSFSTMENKIYLTIDNKRNSRTYGIFSTDDELFSYLSNFKHLYGLHYIEVEGGHRLSGQNLISAVQSGLDYIKKLNMEKIIK